MTLFLPLLSFVQLTPLQANILVIYVEIFGGMNGNFYPGSDCRDVFEALPSLCPWGQCILLIPACWTTLLTFYVIFYPKLLTMRFYSSYQFWFYDVVTTRFELEMCIVILHIYRTVRIYMPVWIYTILYVNLTSAINDILAHHYYLNIYRYYKLMCT